MKFGVFYQMPCAVDQDPAARYQDTITQCQLADQLGFDSVWLAELHFNARFSVMPAPLMVASAIAQTTEKIKIGTAVHLVALHQPIRLAEEAATLDVMSGGRSIFGIGRGAIPTHFQGYGIDQEEARDRFLESLEMVLGMWTQDKYSYEGRYYQANDIDIAPRPLQQPHPPVYSASNSPDTFDIVGQLGHNILVAPTIVTAQGAVDGLGVVPAEPGGLRPRRGQAQRQRNRPCQRCRFRAGGPQRLPEDHQQLPRHVAGHGRFPRFLSSGVAEL